jgi:hypothetical protein
LASKKGDKFECDECGLVVMVENPCEGGCDCEPCEVMCCGEAMKPVSEKSEAKSKPKAESKTSK